MSGAEQREHEVLGVCEDTRVRCENGNVYGVEEIADWKFNYCPYCGASVARSDHRVDADAREVFCEETNQANWRYCPHCGDSCEGENQEGAE
jgi:hypothetical protein